MSFRAGTGAGKVPAVTKLIFGSADLFGGGALNMVGFYYLIFLTDVVQIRPAWAGAILLISRIWDAVTDPAMGVIVDRTRTSIGKRRPYFFVAPITVFVAVALLWFPVSLDAEVSRFLFALFAYLFFSTVSTTVMIPYLSMQPELSTDYNERTAVNVVKMGFSFMAGIIAAVVPLEIVQAFPDLRTGWTVMGLVFAVIYALPWLGIALHIRERDTRADPSPPTFRMREFLQPLRIRTFRMLVLLYLGAYLTLDVMSAVIAFAMSYLFGRPDQLNVVLGTLIVCQLLFLPALGPLTRRHGKGRVLSVTSMIWLAGVAAIAVVPADIPLWGLIGLAVVTGIGVSGTLVIPWTMYPDATDVGYLASGRDVAGSFSGLMVFFRKMAAAVALFLVGLFMDIAGFIEPLQQTIGGVTTNTLQGQPNSVLLTIRLLLVGLPLLLLGMVFLVSRRYPLTQALHARLRVLVDRLRAQAAGIADGAGPAADEEPGELGSQAETEAALNAEITALQRELVSAKDG